jgi:uncharacterized protein (DUF433 family)
MQVVELFNCEVKLKTMGKIRLMVQERNLEIKNDYLKEIAEGKEHDDVMDALSDKHGIGRFYVRTILKEQGIEIERKTEYERSDKVKLSKRDEDIVELFKQETEPSLIADKYEITETRVRQILRKKLGKTFKTPKLAAKLAKLEEIKVSIESGIPYDCSCKKKNTECKCDTIVNKYGKNIIKQIKYNLGYNVFKKALEYKIKDIVRMAKKGSPPKDIAKKHIVTLNYTYMILHDNGIRSKISKEAKKKRDESILEAKNKGQSIDLISENFNLTPTMIRIIIKGLRNKIIKTKV